jgi:hypothetical protein
VMLFDRTDAAGLSEFGELRCPSLSDLFVALLTPDALRTGEFS